MDLFELAGQAYTDELQKIAGKINTFIETAIKRGVNDLGPQLEESLKLPKSFVKATQQVEPTTGFKKITSGIGDTISQTPDALKSLFAKREALQKHVNDYLAAMPEGELKKNLMKQDNVDKLVRGMRWDAAKATAAGAAPAVGLTYGAYKLTAPKPNVSQQG